MDTYFIQFYDLLTRALGSNDPIKLQGFLDEVMAQKYNKLQMDGFTFASDMQLDFTYEQIQKEIGLNVMAQYQDVDSPAIPLGAEGFTISTGKIPRMKLVEYLNEDKIRKALILEQRFGRNNNRVKETAIDNLFVTLDKLIGGHTNSLTYQRHQMISNRGIKLTDTNNPQGIIDVTFSANVPTKNITKLSGTKRWWTNAEFSTEGTTCDPIGDMKAMVNAAEAKGIAKCHFEVNKSFMSNILGHTKVKQALAYKLFPGSQVDNVIGSLFVMSNEDLATALGQIVGAPFKVIDSIVAVEKYNKKEGKLETLSFDAFEKNVIVLIPDGPLGEVLTVEPISVGGIVSAFYGGRLMLTVGYDSVKKSQSFNTEMTCLAVPDKPQTFMYLHPYSA